jgi:hypothetical protein
MIEIIAPRRVSIPLRCTKKGEAYQVSNLLRSFLENRGWSIQKIGQSYAAMTPAEGTSYPFSLEVEISDKEQVSACSSGPYLNI